MNRNDFINHLEAAIANNKTVLVTGVVIAKPYSSSPFRIEQYWHREKVTVVEGELQNDRGNIIVSFDQTRPRNIWVG